MPSLVRTTHKKVDLRKLNRMHYRLLRIAVRDWKRKLSHEKLYEIGRVKPPTWGKYFAASLTIKTLGDGIPSRLCENLVKTLYYTGTSDTSLKCQH